MDATNLMFFSSSLCLCASVWWSVGSCCAFDGCRWRCSAAAAAAAAAPDGEKCLKREMYYSTTSRRRLLPFLRHSGNGFRRLEVCG